jgi:hypothetical protein
MTCNLVFDFHSPHNNEYWYKCTTCGETDWFAYYNRPKKTDSLNTCKEKRQMTANNTNRPRYLWIRPNSVETPLVLIDDPVAIFRGNQFDESVDKLYQIGNEVKMKVVVEPVPNYRLGEDKMKTVRAVSGMKDDLGVGDYRG